MDQPGFSSVSRPGYQREEDNPARRLVLAWQGPSPKRALRWLGRVAVLVIATGAAVFAFLGLLPIVMQELNRNPGDAIGFGVLGVAVVVGAGAICLSIINSGGRATSYVRRITCDASEGNLTLVDAGWILPGRRTRTIPLDSIQTLAAIMGAETARGGLPVQFIIRHGKTTDIETIEIPLPLVGVQRRGEALEVLFRMAKIAGLPVYRALRDDPRQLHVVIMRSAASNDDDDFDEDDEEDDEDLDDEDQDDEAVEQRGAKSKSNRDADARAAAAAAPTYAASLSHDPDQLLAVPDDLAEIRGMSGATRPGFVEPPARTGEVNLAKLDEELPPAHVLNWNPPRNVSFGRDPVTRNILLVVAVLSAALGAGLGAWLLHGAAESVARTPPSRWETAGFGAILGLLLGPFLTWALNRQREVIIDTTLGTITCRQGEQVRTYGTDEVSEVTLIRQSVEQTVIDKNSPDNGKKYMEYRTRIELAVANCGEWMLDSGHWVRDPQQARDRLLPISMEVARMLDVPWRWQDDGARRTAQWFPRLGWKERAVVAAMALSVVGYLYSLNTSERPALAAVERLNEMQVDVSFMSKNSFQDRTILDNYWSVKVSPQDVLQQKVPQLAPLLQEMGTVGVSLEDTPATDADVQSLAPVTNLAYLDLNSTHITGEALDALAGMNDLVYLSVAVTRVDDAGLLRMAALPNLRFLLIGATQISDAGVAALTKFPRLEVVVINGLQVSPQTVGKLRSERPDLTIIER